MIPKVTVLVGPICSGKTTFARKFLATHKNYIRVSKDGFRLMQFQFGFKNASLIHRWYLDSTLSALQFEHNVLIDNCNCHMKYIHEIINKFNHIADIEFIVMPDISFEELRERNIKRGQMPEFLETSEYVLKSFYISFIQLKERFNFQTIKKKEQCKIYGLQQTITGDIKT